MRIDEPISKLATRVRIPHGCEKIGLHLSDIENGSKLDMISNFAHVCEGIHAEMLITLALQDGYCGTLPTRVRRNPCGMSSESFP